MPRPTGERRVHVRANNRALARTRDAHRDEFDRYYEEELVIAQREAQEHLAQVRPPEHEHENPGPPVKAPGSPGPPFRQDTPPIPPRLMPGPKPAGQVRVRDDVAECPYCHRHHDRGHECPSCRSRPPGAPPVPARNPFKKFGHLTSISREDMTTNPPVGMPTASTEKVR